jgi:hypothetical protein
MKRARAAVAAALIGAACALQVQAQQTMSGPGMALPPFTLPPPAYAGKPLICDPQLLVQPGRDQRDGCRLALPCPVQLLGVIGRDGGVMVRGIVLSW